MVTRARCASNEATSAAVDFFRRGFCPIPLNPKSKKAAKDWKHFQHERPSEHEVVRMFAGVDDPGLGVVMGPSSSGLYVRDFDSRETYAAWSAAHLDLSQGFLPTVTTTRGAHVWFRSREVVKSKTIGRDGFDGELKGFGSYVVAPPTVAKSGKPYSFTHAIGDTVPVVRLEDTGLDLRWHGGPATACETQEVDVSSCVSLGDSLVSRGIHEAIVAAALGATIPTGSGQRHQKIFELIRILKASPELAEKPAADLESIFRDWHGRALDRIDTKDWAPSWSDFKSGWTRARSAAFDDPRVAMEIARNSPSPNAAARYSAPRMRDLVGLCSVMQQLRGEQPFFLGCRMAGEVLGLPHATANRYMQKLQHDGVLKVAMRHGVGARTSDMKRMAYEYRYVG